MNGIHYWLAESGRRWANKGGFRYAVLSCYLLVLGFLSLNPWVRPAAADDIFSPDKLVHALAYGGMSIIVFFCFVNSRNEYFHDAVRAWGAALLISVFIGMLIEIAQSFTHNRSGSVEDAAANAIGAGLGYVFYRAVKYVHARVARRV